MSAQGEFGFAILPVELKTKIFNFLNFTERKTLRLVCPNWCVIINDKLKFRAKLTNQTEQWIQGCDYQLQSLSLHNLTKNVSMSSCKKTIPRALDYIIGRGNSSQNVLNFLRFFCTDIRNLTIENLSLSEVTSTSLFRVLPYLRWSSLSTLSVTLGSNGVTVRYAEDYENHIEAVIPVLKSVQVKTLQNLTINLNYGKTAAVETKKVYFKKPWLEILAFIIKHKQSLRDLKLLMYGKPDPPTPSIYSDMISSFSKLRLHSFSIEFDVIHCSFANALCLQLKGLENLKIREIIFGESLSDQFTEKFRVGDIVRMHSKTMNTLCCQTADFECLCLRDFDMLKTLMIKTTHLKFLASAPSLPALTKFCLLTSEDFGNNELPEDLVECVVNRMPNVEELELILLHYYNPFTVAHFEILRTQPKVKRIILGKQPVNSHSLEQFCKGIPGCTFSRVCRPPIHNVIRRYECARIDIDRTFM